MTILITDELKSFIIDFTSTAFWPNSFSKTNPDTTPFTETNYYKFAACFTNSTYGTQNLADTNAAMYQKYDPLSCDENLLPLIMQRVGLGYIQSTLTTTQKRQICYAGILKNGTSGNVDDTMTIFFWLMISPDYIYRYPIGHLAVQYVAINGEFDLSESELNTFWNGARPAGCYVELAYAPTDFLATTTQTEEEGYVYSETHGLGVIQEDGTTLYGGSPAVIIWPPQNQLLY